MHLPRYKEPPDPQIATALFAVLFALSGSCSSPTLAPTRSGVTSNPTAHIVHFVVQHARRICLLLAPGSHVSGDAKLWAFLWADDRQHPSEPSRIEGRKKTAGSIGNCPHLIDPLHVTTVLLTHYECRALRRNKPRDVVQNAPDNCGHLRGHSSAPALEVPTV